MQDTFFDIMTPEVKNPDLMYVRGSSQDCPNLTENNTLIFYFIHRVGSTIYIDLTLHAHWGSEPGVGSEHTTRGL